MSSRRTPQGARRGQAQVSRRDRDGLLRPEARKWFGRRRGGCGLVMVAFHMMHQNAANRVFPVPSPIAWEVLMFAVTPPLLATRAPRRRSARCTASGQLPRWLADAPKRSLSSSCRQERARSPRPPIALRARRLMRAVGTGDPDICGLNIASLLGPSVGGRQPSQASAVSSASGSTRYRCRGSLRITARALVRLKLVAHSRAESSVSSC